MTFSERIAKINIERNELWKGAYTQCAKCKFEPNHACPEHARMFGALDGRTAELESLRDENKIKFDELKRHTDALWTAQTMDWSELNATEKLMNHIRTKWDLEHDL